MYLTGSEQQALRGVFTLLAEDRGEGDIRERLGRALLDLLHADQFASFVWNAESGRFDGRVALNMDPPTSTATANGTSTTTRSPSCCSRTAAPRA